MEQINNQRNYSPKEKSSRLSEFVKDSLFKLAILPVDAALRIANARYELNKFERINRR